jgi:malate dehydrogenase (oxaloacetate-decarboxylating)
VGESCYTHFFDPDANLFPPLTEIRQVSRKIAIAVAKEMVQAGLTDIKNLNDLKKK